MIQISNVTLANRRGPTKKEPMKVLVTGACGFVGGYLIRHLLESGDTVLGGALGEIVDKVPDCTYEKLDVCNSEECSRVIGGFAPDIIYHLAGLAFVPEAEKNFDTTLSVNVAGLHNVMRVPYLLERKTTLLFVSSAEVYGNVPVEALPINETFPLKPLHNYSLSKVFGEMVAERYSRNGFIHSVIARPFNHIGPGQNYRFVTSDFAMQLAKIAHGLMPPVIQVGNLDAKRDFSDVRDIVKGYRLAATQGAGIYNFGSGKAVSIQGILDTLITISGLSIKVERDSERMRPSEIPIVYGDATKAKTELGWLPEHSLEETLGLLYHHWYSRVGLSKSSS